MFLFKLKRFNDVKININTTLYIDELKWNDPSM